MATSIVFGLALFTLLVLAVTPVLLSYLEQFPEWRTWRRSELTESSSDDGRRCRSE